MFSDVRVNVDLRSTFTVLSIVLPPMLGFILWPHSMWKLCKMPIILLQQIWRRKVYLFEVFLFFLFAVGLASLIHGTTPFEIGVERPGSTVAVIYGVLFVFWIVISMIIIIPDPKDSEAKNTDPEIYPEIYSEEDIPEICRLQSCDNGVYKIDNCNAIQWNGETEEQFQAAATYLVQFLRQYTLVTDITIKKIVGGLEGIYTKRINNVKNGKPTHEYINIPVKCLISMGCWLVWNEEVKEWQCFTPSEVQK